MGLTDGAFGGVEKPGQASEMDDVDDSEAFNCPQSHEPFTPALTDGACRSGTNAEQQKSPHLDFDSNKTPAIFPLDHLN